MGSGVSAPLSNNTLAALAALKEEKLKEEGVTEADVEALLQTHLPSIVVFNQIDCDHSGSVSASELKRMLVALPRHGRTVDDGKEPKFVPFENLVETLDSDGDKTITLSEWLTNLPKLQGLEQAIKASVDVQTGKLAKCECWANNQSKVSSSVTSSHHHPMMIIIIKQ